MNAQKLKNSIIAIRWFARIIGMLLFCMVLSIYCAEGFTCPLKFFPTSLYLLILIVGIVLSWRWELWGGILIISGSIAFHGSEMIALGHWISPGVFYFFYLCGFLFVLTSVLNKRNKQ